MTTETRTRPATGSSRQALTVLLTSVANFMVTLDALVVMTALPSIHRSLGGGITTLQWTITAYTMSFGAGIVTAAELGDRFGRRRVYLLGLMAFTTASAACALAPNAGTLIGFRALQGIGAACVMPLGMTLLTSAFPPERRGAVVGIWQGIAGLAIASGPLVGGALTQGRAGTGSSGSTSPLAWLPRSAVGRTSRRAMVLATRSTCRRCCSLRPALAC